MNYPNYENVYSKDIKVGDKVINIKIGMFCEQSAAAVLATCGETVVHTTIGLGRKVNLGYFPLSVEYSKKLYSSGIIKGSRWVKRQGRPTDDSILSARVIDRSIRPLFPEGIKNEVQVINTIFSYDGINDADMLAMLATTVGLSVSQIPFNGPISGVRVGYDKENKKFFINPTNEEQENSALDLIVSGSDKAVVMVEAGADEVEESIILEAMSKAQEVLGSVCKDIEEIKKAVGKEKVDLSEVDPAKDFKDSLRDEIYTKHTKKIKEMVQNKALLKETGLDTFNEELVAEYTSKSTEEIEVTSRMISELLEVLLKKEARRMILEEGTRPDGRKTDEIRQIWCDVDVFPRTHGSAMFKRGATQACTITTLGNPSLAQIIEDIDGEETRHYIHHYNSPPYSFGSTGRFGFPKRREIGHGSLAERALLPMIPSQEDFPYTIRVVSEIMSSNGSTSQASVCGSTMSLMAAGVPIKKPVAGIAMGLMSDGKKYVVLSDIQGLEDHVGDMDFKVAGSADGVTAIQMDIKLTGLPFDVLKKALKQAKDGRMHIMAEMLKCIDKPRTVLSQFAPKVAQITIPAKKIGEVIGTGGKIIKGIIEASGADVNVEEDEERKLGIINISSANQSEIDKAKQMIEDLTREVVVGDEFDGPVTRVESYGAFMEFLPGREGLVHVSQMSAGFVKSAEDIVSLGDTVHVRVTGFKDDGKIQLSMLSEEESAKQKQEGGSRPRGGNGGSDRRRRFNSPRRDNYRGGDRGNRGNDRRSSNRNSYGSDSRGGQDSRRNSRNDRSGRNGNSRTGRDGNKKGGSNYDKVFRSTILDD